MFNLHLGWYEIVGRLWISDSKFKEIHLFKKLWYMKYVAGLGVEVMVFGFILNIILQPFPKEAY